MYIHSPVARTFFCTQCLHSHSCTFSCVCTYTHDSSSSRVKKMFVAHVSNLSILPSLSHVSPVSAVPVHPLRHPLSVHNLAVLSRPKSAGHAPLRNCIEKFGYLAKSDANTGDEPKKFDKITSVDSDTMHIDDPDLDEISGFSKTIRENTVLFGVPSV